MQYRRLFESGCSCFLTLVTYRRSPIFSDPNAIHQYRLATQKVQAKRPFTVEAEVILPDHVHTLWSLPSGDVDYPTRVRLMKTYFSRNLGNSRPNSESSASRISKGEVAVWQRRYWEHTIRHEKDFETHVDYIHFNPVKHGLVSAARDWPHSTFLEWVARGVYEEWWGSQNMPPLPDWAGRE
jgi:putative transposase